MLRTYQEIISVFKIITISGNSVLQDFGSGNAWDIDTQQNKFPLLWIDPYLKDHQYKNGVLYLNADIYILDLVKDDRSNEIYVISDMIRVAIDLINNMKDNYDAYGFWIQKEQGGAINIQQFSEKWDDRVSGVKFNVNIEVIDDGSTCENIFTTVVSEKGTVW